MTTAEELLRLAYAVPSGEGRLHVDELREVGDGRLWAEEDGEKCARFFATCTPQTIAALMKELIELRSR